MTSFNNFAVSIYGDMCASVGVGVGEEGMLKI